ncbi:MAG: DUF642 domain-containing protein [Bryobacteraceae bacterium]
MSLGLKRSLVGIVVLLALPMHAAADPIINGSFETPVMNPGTYQDFGVGSTGITGWTVVGDDSVSLVSGAFTQESIAFVAEDGSQWVDLAGQSSNNVEGVEQTVATTVGTTYTLSFWVGNVYDGGVYFGPTSSVEAVLGGIMGTPLDTVTNSIIDPTEQSWEQFSFQFTASGTATTIDFLNQSPASNWNTGLDNVQLTANGARVPEPGTMSLLGAGLILGLGLFRRRKAI